MPGRKTLPPDKGLWESLFNIVSKVLLLISAIYAASWIISSLWPDKKASKRITRPGR